MLDIIFGENSGTLPAQALQHELSSFVQRGTLYLGYPILSTAETNVFVDALLISEDFGCIAFDLTSQINGNYLGIGEVEAIKEKQNQTYAALYNKLNQHKDLRRGRTLAIDPKIVTYHTGISEITIEEELVVAPSGKLRETIEPSSGIPATLLRPLNAAIQRVSTLRPAKKRDNVTKEGSRGAILKRIEREIANLDHWQNRGAIEYANGPQRIRGLAGSGKTVVLALKAAYLHVRHPEWRIAVTFQSRSLYQQFRDLIRRFTYDQTEDDPDWNHLLVMHAWGSTREAGMYSTACATFGLQPLDWKTADNKYGSRSFEGVCEEVNKVIEVAGPKRVFDAVLIDEAQDFPTSFYRMVYNMVPEPHRIMWAYDDLQNLGDYEMRSEEVLFGSDGHGNALVNLRNENDRPKEDIVLPVCYRNTPWALATAHALGFGIYREQGLVQMFEEPSIWPRIGYETVRGTLELGQHVLMRRRPDSFPSYFHQLLTPEDAVQCRVFETELDQYAVLAEEIKRNIEEDELEHTDILIVVPNTYTSRKTGARIMRALANQDIFSHLVGVTTSRDEVFQNASIAITHIYRAKGNEAPMVYIVNCDYCRGGFELSRKRNILFTAITRSRCWVRAYGVGDDMTALKREFESVASHQYELEFDYPNQEQIMKLARVHRDMTDQERKLWASKMSAVEEVMRALEEGDVPIDALPATVRERLGAAFSKAQQ